MRPGCLGAADAGAIAEGAGAAGTGARATGGGAGRTGALAGGAIRDERLRLPLGIFLSNCNRIELKLLWHKDHSLELLSMRPVCRTLLRVPAASRSSFAASI